MSSQTAQKKPPPQGKLSNQQEVHTKKTNKTHNQKEDHFVPKPQMHIR